MRKHLITIILAVLFLPLLVSCQKDANGGTKQEPTYINISKLKSIDRVNVSSVLILNKVHSAETGGTIKIEGAGTKVFVYGTYRTGHVLEIEDYGRFYFPSDLNFQDTNGGRTLTSEKHPESNPEYKVGVVFFFKD